MKKRLLISICTLALICGLVPSAALADDIMTDVVIHKMVVESGTSLAPHDGKEITDFTGTNLEDATTLEGALFKYWTVSPATTPAQLAEIKGLATFEEVQQYAASNPTILTGGTETPVTDAQGVARVNGMSPGMYLFAETNGPDHNVSEYIGIPFILELPMMQTDGRSYFGTGADALHIYPKNSLEYPGLDVKTVNESGTVIGGATFRVELLNPDSGDYETATSVGTNGIISLPGGTVNLTELPAGAYQLINTKAPGGYFVDERPVKFTVSAGEVSFDSPNSPMASFTPGEDDVNPLITVKYAKKPDVTKTEASGGTEQVGKTVTWTIKSDIPTAIEDYQVFTFTDTIDTRLDFSGVDKIVVAIEGGDTLVVDTNYEVTYAGQLLTVVFKPATLETYVGSKVVITYETVINETALMGEEITNNAELSFDNGQGGVSIPGDPDNPPITPTDPPGVWTGGAAFVKVDGSDDSITLAGAEFKIATNADGTGFLVWTNELIEANDQSKFVTPVAGEDIVAVSDADGSFEIRGLKGGTYYLVETKAPNVNGTQYNLMAGPEAFEITQTSYLETNALSVENNSGLQIPLTGGIGTALFTIIGVALMVTAIVLYRRRKATSGE